MVHLALVAYELENGGISRVAAYLANSFAEAGHRVSLLLCTSAGECDVRLRGVLRDDVAYVALSHRPWGSRAWGQVRTWRSYRRWLAAERPDIVIATANNISWFSGIGVALSRGRRPRLFVKTTNPVIRENDGRLLTALRRFGYGLLFGGAEAVLTLSEAESRWLSGHFPKWREKFRAVFNPYLSDAFGRFAAPSRDGDALNLIAIGRLSPQKNFTRLLRGFALARDIDRQDDGGHLVRAHLSIVGDGPERAQLEALAARLDLRDHVGFLGFRDDVPALLGKADIFVLSSNYEGLPAVVIEALGSHCRVASTDCFPAVFELLDGLSGCAIGERTDEGLAGAILACAKAPPDAGLRARALDYDLDSAARSHLAAMGLG